MTTGDPAPKGLPSSTTGAEVVDADRSPGRGAEPAGAGASIVVTEVNPFHCLYQDALEFHSQSRLMLGRSESSSSRLARAALLLYVASAEALVHQAAAELGRPDLARLVADPSRPLPLLDAWRLLPAILGRGSAHPLDPSTAPWPQFAELLAVRTSWAYPGAAPTRRAYYRASRTGTDFEPLQPHQVPKGTGLAPDALHHPKTGLPRDPYALRPHHLDTARGILDAAIAGLDQRLEGALTRDNRHRRELTSFIQPPR